jgi:hypothetical protein
VRGTVYDGDLADEYRRQGRPLMPTHRAFLSFDPGSGKWDHHITSFNGEPAALPGGTLPPHPVCPTSALVAAHKGALWCIAGLRAALAPTSWGWPVSG